MKTIQTDQVREAVRENYSKIAKTESEDCGCAPSCCGEVEYRPATDKSLAMGYSPGDLSAAPESANLGLGCGNPGAIASLQEGETVLDLGSGGGFDAFLAARAVGKTGQVIGVDMTAEMIALARDNARKATLPNVEFRLGEIEHLPLADSSVDVIISNCVINLSPEKESVFREAFRVLRPGGRLAISDIVAVTELPDHIEADLAMHCACISGAVTVNILETLLGKAGFTDISIRPKEESRSFIQDWSTEQGVDEYIRSAVITARKPKP